MLHFLCCTDSLQCTDYKKYLRKTKHTELEYSDLFKVKNALKGQTIPH